MDIRAAEISSILKTQIANFGAEAHVTEVGQVLSVGDGIARAYGLDKVEAGEMVDDDEQQLGLARHLAADARLAASATGASSSAGTRPIFGFLTPATA